MPIADRTYQQARYDEVIFRSHRLTYYIKLGVVFGFGVACLALANRVHPFWLAGLLPIVYSGATLVNRYTGGSLAICGYDLVIRTGHLTTHELITSIGEVRPSFRQGLISRLFDCGVVVIDIHGEIFEARITNLRAFRQLILLRRSELITMIEQQSLLTLPLRQWVHADVE